MVMNTTLRMSESGQVNIPSSLRERLHWQGAMELDFQLTSSGLLIQPKEPQAKRHRLEELRGLLRHEGNPLSDEQLCAPVDCMESE